eukprot:195171_1
MAASLKPAFYQNLDIDSLNYLIELAINAERQKDACVLLLELANKRYEKSVCLADNELENFAINIKSHVRSIRDSISYCPDDEESIAEFYKCINKDDKKNCYKNSLKTKLVKELHHETNIVITILNDKLIPNAHKNTNYPHVCTYYRLCGDFYRYLLEYPLEQDTNDDNIDYKNVAVSMYLKSIDIAKKYCSKTDTIYLKCFNNYAVFLHEILKQNEKAINMCKSAFDEAMDAISPTKLNSIGSSLSDTLQLMRDNYTSWSTTENDSNK